jgi:2-dehydro-3-deoxyphosphogluconate aldolase/(4S)-4-hydroxy-2-oxoglutarate aldolase
MSLLDRVPVVPVVVIDTVEHAVPVARALAGGGLPVIELTLRTPVALEAIRAIADEVPEILIGAGTVNTPQQAEASVAAGAQFLVSPGATPTLLSALQSTGIPFLPGVATVSEALAAYERGITELKFFPAEASGGVAFLSSLAGPLPQLRFCPTGGITPATAPDYLRLPNVACVGGSWLTPKRLLEAGDYDAITSLARTAASMGGDR